MSGSPEGVRCEAGAVGPDVGEVDADSTPPGEHQAVREARTSAEATSTAARPEAHCRSTVRAGTRRGGRPSGRRPGDVAAGPGAVAEHHLVARLVDELGQGRPAPGPRGPPRATEASAPPAVPIGVRSAATTTGWRRCRGSGHGGNARAAACARPSAPETRVTRAAGRPCPRRSGGAPGRGTTGGAGVRRAGRPSGLPDRREVAGPGRTAARTDPRSWCGTPSTTPRRRPGGAGPPRRRPPPRWLRRSSRRRRGPGRRAGRPGARRGPRPSRSRPRPGAAGRPCVVPQAEVRRAHPHLAVTDGHLDARERAGGRRRALPTPRRRARPRRSSGDRRAGRTAGSCHAGARRSPATTTVRSPRSSRCRASRCGVRKACVASWTLPTTVAPRKAACTSANRFIVALTGPGTHTREDGDRPARAATAPNEPTHDSVVRTTDRAAPRCPTCPARGFARRVRRQERPDRFLRQSSAPRHGCGAAAAVPGRPRARRARRGRTAPP